MIALLLAVSSFALGLLVVQVIQSRVAKNKPLKHAKALIVLGSGRSFIGSITSPPKRCLDVSYSNVIYSAE